MSNEKSMRYEMFRKGIFIDPMVEISKLNQLVKLIRPLKIDTELIRMGAASDGGYLIPNDLDGITSCFSPGVDNIASFEQALATRSIGSHLADFSVDTPPPKTSALSFEKKYIDAVTHGHFISLEDWVNTYEPQSTGDSLILQMDIEGSEYKSLLACPEYILNKFRIMVIEFHQVESWSQVDFFSIVEAVFAKLLQTHSVVHSHPNNVMGLVDLNGFLAPRVFEMTFYTTNKVRSSTFASLPHPLDQSNVVEMPPLEFPSNWL